MSARTRFNVEMQVTLQKFLPRRGRYYHDQIDMDVKDTGRTETISTTDPFVRYLQDMIDAIKQNRSMEERYMLLEEIMRNEKQEGRQQGSQEMLISCLIDSLKSKFSLSDTVAEKIMSETNISKLQTWFQLSLKVSSIEEFEENM